MADHRAPQRPPKYRLAARVLWRLTGYPAQEVLGVLEHSQWWPPGKLVEFRNDKFRRLIRHCYDQVPYYRGVMERLGLGPGDFRELRDLPKLPVLTKDLFRANQESLQARSIPQSRTNASRTGGTTGEPIVVRRTRNDAVWQNQCYARGLSWGGLAPHMQRISLFGGSLGQRAQQSWPKKLWHRFADTSILLPAFQLSGHNVNDYLDRIEASGCRHLIGYASAVYMLAVLSEQVARRLGLETVFPTAEQMPEAWKAKVNCILGGQALCYYGCGEVNSLGYQCRQGEAYHRCDEHAVLEVMNGDGSASFEGEGPLLISDLDSYAMPILRYANGDCGALSDTPCACGRSGGLITRLGGRVNDFLVTRAGERISGAIAPHTFRHVRGAVFYQYVQDRPGSVTVRVVTNEQYQQELEERRIRGILRDTLGADTEVLFEYPPDIERTPAGKARFVINNYLASSAPVAGGGTVIPGACRG